MSVFKDERPLANLNIWRKSIKQRLAEFRKPRFTSGYRILNDGHPTLKSFYLDSDFAPNLRWEWADEIADEIEHKGWFTDPEGDGDTIRGVVFFLTHKRGCLAGWSMGEEMASLIDTSDTYDCPTDAAMVANEMARDAAEEERERELKWRESHEQAI